MRARRRFVIDADLEETNPARERLKKWLRRQSSGRSRSAWRVLSGSLDYFCSTDCLRRGGAAV